MTAANTPAGDPFIQRLTTTVAVVLLAALLLTLVVKGIGVLLSAFAGVLVAVVLHAAATALAAHTPLRYGWALALTVLLVLALVAGAAWVLGGRIAAEAEEFGRMLPEVAAEARDYLERHGWGQWLLQQLPGGEPDEGGEGGVDAGMGGTAALLSALAALSTAFSYALVAVFVGLFGAANPRLYVDGIVALTPPQRRAGMTELLAELGHTLRRWLLGQGLAMIIIGISTGVMLGLFGVRLALVVGLVVGLLGFIPYLGPIIGIVPVAVVAGPEGTATLLWVLLAYTAVQMLEGYGITPLIFERTVYLPPVFTIVLQILLGAVLGLKGIVLATPLAAVVLVLSRAYRRSVLGDDVPLRPGRHAG